MINKFPVGDQLSIKQVAAKLGVDPQTVRRWIDKGLLPATDYIGRILIDPADLPAFLEKAKSTKVAKKLEGVIL